jgi:hypothetical protein
MQSRSVFLVAALAAAVVAPAGAQELNAVFGFGPNDIWAVGDRPAAIHWDGRAWTEVPFGVSLNGSLNGLWGSGPRDLFAIGSGGQILHWDGTAWSQMRSPVQADLAAITGRSATEVYVVTQSPSDREPGQLLRYDGRAWTATPLTVPFRPGAATVLGGGEVVVVGVAYFDPQPNQRRQVGVVARFSAGRWSVAGWDGQRAGDPNASAAGWLAVGAAGGGLVLWGRREDGTSAFARSSGAGWTLLPPAASAMSNTRVELGFVAGDGVPVAIYNEGFARFTAAAWTAAVPPMVAMQQAMMQQSMQGQQTPQQRQQQQRLMEQYQQMMANPMLMAARMAAWDLSGARGVWSPSASDFYLTTSSGRVVHITGNDAMVVYDATCADPMTAGMNPICQMLMQQQQNR